MKLSLSQMALVAALTLSISQVEAWRNDCGDATRVVGRGCPCAKPRPKPPVAPRAGEAKKAVEVTEADCSTTERCPCNKPKPKPKPKAGEATKAVQVSADDCTTAERCPCNKPKPKPKKDTTKVAQYVETFRSSTPSQQRDQLVSQVKQYVNNPNDTTAQMLTACAQAYCDRVENPALNKLVKELLSSNDKKTVQASILRTLEVR